MSHVYLQVQYTGSIAPAPYISWGGDSRKVTAQARVTRYLGAISTCARTDPHPSPQICRHAPALALLSPDTSCSSTMESQAIAFAAPGLGWRTHLTVSLFPQGLKPVAAVMCVSSRIHSMSPMSDEVAVGKSIGLSVNIA
jgi:hypothetical protein